MKEATGELNMTVITVVAIAAVAAFFVAFIWPAIENNLTNTTKCNAASNCVITGDVKTCDYIKEDKSIEKITCPLSEADKN